MELYLFPLLTHTFNTKTLFDKVKRNFVPEKVIISKKYQFIPKTDNLPSAIFFFIARYGKYRTEATPVLCLHMCTTKGAAAKVSTSRPM